MSILSIKGEGSVEKMVVVNSTTIEATPSEHWKFKHFIVSEAAGKKTITESRFTFDTNAVIGVVAVFYAPIETYLRGLVSFDVSDIALNSIRVRRDIPNAADIESLSVKKKELAYADLLMWAATSYSSYSGAKSSDGGWSETEASKTITVTDKKRFESIANSIYKKYRDSLYSTNIKIVNLW